ncbi:MAG: leucyl/phenylalanyl-tRNA--protein transferase [Ignavibacteriae bacterium]|nr:MAG: leucyl/phenylalanyl-tRNA--protein transferase [Ignavibacteriota bacterium]
MKSPIYKYYQLSWKEVLQGYTLGIFPMGEDDGSISWYETSPRAILPVESQVSGIHIPRSLSQVLKKNIFNVKVDTVFSEVIHTCAERDTTWINPLIIDAFTDLYKQGYAHSVEAWDNKGLAGGLYGVAYKGAFFGESMFFKRSNASKVAVIKLYEILKKNNYILLDIQMMTSHFRTFGAVDISKKAYLEVLERAMKVDRKFG